MKNLYAAVLVSLASAAFANPLEFWAMNDPAGTGLESVKNSGSRGSAWNFPTPDGTDGQGNFVVKGDGGAFSRKLPAKGSATAVPDAERYLKPVAKGAYRLELNFSSWTIAEGSATAGDTFSFGVNDAQGERIARISIRPGKDVQFSGFDGAYRTASLEPVQQRPVSFAIEFDFDADTITYFKNGTNIYTGAMTGKEFSTVVYNKNGEWNTSGIHFKIDSMGLKAIESSAVESNEPEQDLLGLITG